MDEDGNGRAGALEDVAYLARSTNRIDILEALADTELTRHELRERTGVARATLARIVSELEERDWVERASGTEYTATATGRHVVAQFLPLLESMTAVRQLGEAVEWLPIDDLEIDLRHFADAQVIRPANDDPVAVVDHLGDLLQTTSDFRALTHYAPPDALARIITERLDADAMDLRIVTTSDVIEHLQGRDERRAQVQAWFDAGAELYLLEDALPCNLWTMDETVIIKKSGPDARERSYGIPIVSRNPTVHAWATDLMDDFRARATPLTADAFAEDREGAGAATEET